MNEYTRSKQPRIIKISIRDPDQSDNDKFFRNSSKKREDYNSIVPIPIDDYHSLSSMKTIRNVPRFIRTVTLNSSQVSPYQNNINNNRRLGIKHTKDIKSNSTGMTRDFHGALKKNKHKKCSRKCIIISVLTILLVSIITIGILLGLLIKSKTGTTNTPSITPVLRWSTTGITIAGISGTAGNTSDQLNLPRDIILVYPNLLYVADYQNNRIQKYVIGTLNGITVAGDTNGVGGVLESQLKNPSRILIDANGGVTISDTDNNRVQYWINSLSNGTTIAGDPAGSTGNTNNRLYSPYGLAYDSSSNVLFISDQANMRIMQYASGASSGTMVAGDGTAGTATTQLNYPVGLYLDSSSNSFVIANHLSHNIVRWVLGATNWTLLAGNINGVSGNSSTELCFPTDMIFDPMGNMYVPDRDNQRIQLFMAGQFTGITIAGVTGISGGNASLLNMPWSIKLDSQLNLYVADSGNHRIQKFLRY